MAVAQTTGGEAAGEVSEVLAAVDIGTNSVHLVVARVTGAHAFEVLERHKEVVRLGSGGGDMKELGDEAVERGLTALGRCRQIADAHDARIVAVATSAVREAENRATFIERARAEAGIEIEVVSGFEEARLIHLGVLQAVPVFDRRLVLCDIGGGSTELLVGAQGEPVAARSLKLGAIRLTDRYFRDDATDPEAVESCRRHVRAMLAPFCREVRRLGFDVAVGASGTIGAVCALASAVRGDPSPRTWNNFELSRQDLGAAMKALAEAPTVAARSKLPGMDARRADIALAGALILEQVFEELDLESMTFSEHALREGVLLDAWQRRHGTSLHHLSDLRRRSVVRLAELMDEDPRHSAHVAQLALELFDATRAWHELGDDAREYLEAAALLCNVGVFLSHAGHHRHTYYVIRNSELLTGFTDREIELVAQVARYHRKSPPKDKHEEFAALDPDDKRLVRCCAGLLRVAIALDRTRDRRVAGVRVGRGDDGSVIVEALPRDGADVELEVFSGAESAQVLAGVLGVGVEVVEADRPG